MEHLVGLCSNPCFGAEAQLCYLASTILNTHPGAFLAAFQTECFENQRHKDSAAARVQANMDIKTVEFKPFTDQKPGTYVTVNPAPASPRQNEPLLPKSLLLFVFRLRNAATLTHCVLV